MSAYSIVKLKEEVEDSLGERAPGIEGRFARKHLDSEHLGISYLRYRPGVRSPSAHSHREQEEAYVVISGSGQVRLDDEIRKLRCWDVVRVNPATVRAFEAGGGGLELIAIGSDRPDGGDGSPYHPGTNAEVRVRADPRGHESPASRRDLTKNHVTRAWSG